ncbi:MAG TPA: hypothetical protein VKS60_17050 [Stellaceae bacterium]|nr:hypothetical protein [Stellaceae bacterium]
MTEQPDFIVLGRSCGSCTLCCKVLPVPELDKPQGVWCSNCKPGGGCLIHPIRPQVCRGFFCGYLTVDNLGEEWKPERCRFVIMGELDGSRIGIHVDPDRPDAWRREPFYSRFKEWAARAVPIRGQVVVWVQRRITVIFPDRDVDLGILGEDEHVVTTQLPTAHGVILDAVKRKNDNPADPRAPLVS